MHCRVSSNEGYRDLNMVTISRAEKITIWGLIKIVMGFC